MEGESHDNCMLVTFEVLQRMSGGEVGKVRCQEMWNGSLDGFRAAHRGVAVVGYNQMEDGQVGPAVMLNEKVQMPGDSPAAGVITPEVMKKIEDDMKSGTAKVANPPVQAAERVFKDGDSFIKTVGDKVYRLGWKEYDDASAAFDRKIKVEDGRIYVTEWKELKG